MSWKELEDYFETLPDRVMEDASEVVSETAIEYFKESFSRKEFDGNPWTPPKKGKRRGSLLIDSGALINSITEKERSKEHVVISAGNTKVPYAKVHNEGFSDWVNVPAHSRKGKQVKAHTKKMNIPARPFIGKANALASRIVKRLQAYLNAVASTNK